MQQTVEGFDSIDLAIAEEFAGDQGEDSKLALAYLSKASRNGHLCVQYKGEVLAPSMSDMELDETLTVPIISGLAGLPEGTLARLEAEDSWFAEPVGVFDGRYYLQRNWIYETRCLFHLRRLLAASPDIQAPPEFSEEGLLPEQGEAVRTACRGSLSIISGGPGTGKTYTAGHLIRLLLEGLRIEDREHFQIALAAPTGKAAANLQSSLNKACPGLNLSAQTLHSLLRDDRPLLADLVLVDECSMVDARLMAQLLASVRSGSRLILLGDKDQLPPVEAGSLFSDMTRGDISSLTERTVVLKTCLRAELEALLSVAQRVNDADLAVSASLEEGALTGIQWRDLSLLSERAEYHRALVDAAGDQFDVGAEQKPEEILQAFSRLRLLSPLRRGRYGVDYVNQVLLQYYQERSRKRGAIAIPIMIAKNDYRLGLFNGEVGALIRHLGRPDKDYALFHDDSGIRKVSALLLPRYEYAYCLSVHKSQGSEFSHILLLLPPGSETFGKEVLYTAITRARRGLELWGSLDILERTISRSGNRFSGLVVRMGDS